MIIIDRFEGEKAVLETDSGMRVVDRLQLPRAAREGDVLIEKDDGSFTLLRSAAAERRSLVRRKLRTRLIRKNDE